MKTPDENDDDGAEDEADEGDFDGVSHQSLAVPLRLFECDPVQITTTILVQRWISTRRDKLVPRILTPVLPPSPSQDLI